MPAPDYEDDLVFEPRKKESLMDKKLSQLEREIMITMESELRICSPEERQSFIKGRISGLRTALDLIKGQFVERVAILKEIAEKDLEK